MKAIVAAYYGRHSAQVFLFRRLFKRRAGCTAGRPALSGRLRLNHCRPGTPTIDNTDENTFVHGWNVRVNLGTDGTSILTADKIPRILTADKIPALAKAALAACADNSGMIQDPRACHFDATPESCAKAPTPPIP